EYSLNAMSVTRNASTRRSVGGTTNGERPARRSDNRKISGEELQLARQQARIEELQARLRWLESEHDRVSWLFDAVPVGFVLMDEHGNVREFNAQFEKMLGFKRGFLAPGSLAPLVLQSDLSVFLDHLRRCKSAQDAISSELRMRNGKRA